MSAVIVLLAAATCVALVLGGVLWVRERVRLQVHQAHLWAYEEADRLGYNDLGYNGLRTGFAHRLRDSLHSDVVASPLAVQLRLRYPDDHHTAWQDAVMWLRLQRLTERGWTIESLDYLAARRVDPSIPSVPFRNWVRLLGLREWEHACDHDASFASACTLAGLTVADVRADPAAARMLVALGT